MLTLALAFALAPPTFALSASKPVVVVREGKEQPTKVKVGQPGVHHGDEAPVKNGDRVFAYCDGALVAVVVKVKTVMDEVTETKTAKDVDVGCAARFYVKGDAGLVAGKFANRAVVVDNLYDPMTLNDGRVLRRASEQHTTGNIVTSRQQLQLVTKEEGKAEDVAVLYDVDDDTAAIDVVFVGDLNGDGKDDVVFNGAVHNNATTLRLFLSDKTGALRELGHHTTTGC